MKPSTAWLSVREAADLLGYRSLRSVHNRIKDGTLKARRHSVRGISPRWYVSKRSVSALLVRQRRAKS